MATYDYLPVYKVSYDLLVELFRFTKDFTREYKFTLGESIKNEVIEMIRNIYPAPLFVNIIYVLRIYFKKLFISSNLYWFHCRFEESVKRP